MDAVEKAAEALAQDAQIAQLTDRAWPPDDPNWMRRQIARAVLDAVGYPHESSDEGTCWCPVAEQAGRERDAAIDQRDSLHEVAAAAIRERDALRAERDQLRERIVTVDIDGRTMRYDKLAEAEAALADVEQACMRLQAERDRYHKALYRVGKFGDELAAEIARATLAEPWEGP